MTDETEIIASIEASLIWRAVIMYVETFKTDVIFVGKIIMCLIWQWPIITSIRVSPLILTITLRDQKKNIQITDNKKYLKLNFVFW